MKVIFQGLIAVALIGVAIVNATPIPKPQDSPAAPAAPAANLPNTGSTDSLQDPHGYKDEATRFMQDDAVDALLFLVLGEDLDA
ncbi:hypothetical protein BDQ17DRAFT_1435348 [Cyathus striatus]|nr:hypothetical protein BDQ17DRAFT_1435348 [Cyathus striatus]